MTPTTQIHSGLTTLVHTWDRRLRIQQTVGWFSRALIPGLIFGVLAGIVSRWRPLLDNRELLIVSLLAILLGIAAMIAYVWGRNRGVVESARRFDMAFGLQERVSTALELIEGRIRADETLALLQTEDAYSHARGINADERLRFRFNRDEWLAVGVLALILALLVILPNTVATRAPIDPERTEIIARGEEAIEDAIETVATDATLDDATRSELLEALEANLAILQDEAISADEALAIMGDVERMLQGEANNLREQSESDQQALDSAAEALNSQAQENTNGDPQASEGEGDPNAPSDAVRLDQAIRETQQQLEESQSDSMSEAEQQSAQGVLSENLQSASQAVEALSSALSQSLQQASESIQQGDMSGAQEALQRAQELAQQQQAQAEQTGDSAQNLQDATEQMQQAQAQDQQGQQPTGQQSEQGQPQDQQATGQGMQGQAQQDQPGQQGQGQNADQAGDGQAQGASGETQQGGDPQGQSAQSDASLDSDNVGTGQESGDPAQDTRGQVTGEMNPSEAESQGEGQYEAIYDPNRTFGEGSGAVELSGDPEGALIREGDFTDNPAGNALVPYNQVFSDYADAANEALDSSYIPLGLRDVVREYFSSLAPSRRSDEGQ